MSRDRRHPPKENTLADTLTREAALWLAIAGLFLILLGNAFSLKLLKVSIDDLVANIGALLLIIGILQWLFDKHARKEFFSEVRSEIIGSVAIADSGICLYEADSRSVDLSQQIITSNRLIIGMNYSPTILDANISSLSKRAGAGKLSTIVYVDPTSPAGTFIKLDYNNPDIEASIRKLTAIVQSLNSTSNCVEAVAVTTALRYSFIMYDSGAWVIPGTNGAGRRAVPGFAVRSGSTWFQHFEDDVQRLLALRTSKDV